MAKRKPKPPIEPLHVTQDTREQTPWDFSYATRPPVIVTRAGLPVGDYALRNDSRFAIERKSLSDFGSSVGPSGGWQNMLMRVSRMGNMDSCPIIVEGTWCNVLDRMYSSGGRTRITPQLLGKRIAVLGKLGVPVYFAGDAVCAAILAFFLFKERALHNAKLQEGRTHHEIDTSRRTSHHWLGTR